MIKKHVIFLIIIFIGFISLKMFNSKPKTITYKIDNYNIKENYLNDKLFLTIEKNNEKYHYLYSYKGHKVVEKIESYKDENYNCIFVSFSDNQTTNDFLCYKDGMNYYFSTITNESNTILKSYEDLIESGKIKKDIDDVYNTNNVDLFKIYNNNLNSDFIFSLTYYKGLYIFNNNEIKKINLFDSDVYDQKVKVFFEDKYIIADYNEQYTFNSFYVVNLKNGKYDKIKFKYNISFNSKILGIKNDNIYLYDNDNKKYYEINMNNNNVTLLNNSVEIKNKLITDYEIIFENDYYYYLMKNNTLYKSSSKSIDNITHLFKLDNKYNLKIEDDIIYWLEDNNIKYYYKNGFKTLIYSEEFSFNKTLDFYVIKNN